MKKLMLLMIAMTLFVLPCLSACAEESFNARQQLVFDTVKYCNDVPKQAQITGACEYYCKVEGYPLRALIIGVRQTEHIANHFGLAARVILLDTDTGEVVTYTTFREPMGEVTSASDALHLLFNHVISLTMDQAEQIYADHEMLFWLSIEEVRAVNDALTQHFTR